METIKLVKEFLSKGVVGFDIAADEAGYSLDNHVDAFNYAKKNSYLWISRYPRVC